MDIRARCIGCGKCGALTRQKKVGTLIFYYCDDCNKLGYADSPNIYNK